ncbi:MAG: quinone oxidoreductase putative PIG3 [Alphaproteobacteria bacterium]|nr:MAG: quinone oxidoreductase putative PIG3 [Alphaproteobacteria bacterium]
MNAPKTMRAVIHALGEPLRVGELATPVPGQHEILIKVAAAGVNRPDLMQRAGLYPPPPGAPATMGLEAAGTVAAAGSAVTRWREGDEVTALLGGGGYAEYALVDEGSALRIPKGLSMEEAAGLPETVFTVWANVFESGALKPGETFLVHGGASGIGTTAIQMAKAHGARVFATAGDGEKVALCERLGAERGINYKTEDFESVLRGAGGVDVILDMVAGPYTQKNLDILNDGGRCVLIAFLQGPTVPQLNLMRILLKRLTLTGSTLRSRPDRGGQGEAGDRQGVRARRRRSRARTHDGGRERREDHFEALEALRKKPESDNAGNPPLPRPSRFLLARSGHRPVS